MEQKQICDALRENLPEIVRRWSALTEDLPWGDLTPEERTEHVPEVILGLARAAICAPGDAESHSEKIWKSAAHGESRRARGLPETTLLAEYSLLRQAIWSYIRDLDTRPERALEAITRMDLAMTLATQAAMHGYNRQEMERLGLWPKKIEQLTRASPLLQASLPPC